MITGETDLAAVAAAILGGDAAGVPPDEQALLSGASKQAIDINSYISEICAGLDPLGDGLCDVRSPETRRGRRVTYTPAVIVDAIVGWAVSEGKSPARIVDPGAGSGCFTMAAAPCVPP